MWLVLLGLVKNKWLQKRARSIQDALAQSRSSLVWRDIRSIRERRAGFQPVRCCAVKKRDGELCVGLEETLCRWREHFEGALNVISSSEQTALDNVEQLLLRSELAEPPNQDEILGPLG